MVQMPNAVGLILCRLVIVEEHTRNVTLANSFQRLKVSEFPSTTTAFAVFTTLTDGLGNVVLDLIVSRTDTLEDVYTRSFEMDFRDPLKQVRLWWQVRSCSFPVPGAYQIALQGNGELITQCVLEVT